MASVLLVTRALQPLFGGQATTTTVFANGEIKPTILESVRGRAVFILASGFSSDDRDGGGSVNDQLMETLILCRACRTASAASITVFELCFPYARQDKKHAAREPITARLVCDLLATAGATRLAAFDLHSTSIQGFTDLPFDHLYAESFLIEVLPESMRTQPADWVIVAPDAGAIKRARHLAGILKVGVAVMDKERDYQNPNVVLKAMLIGDVAGKHALVVDDMLDTAGTALRAAQELMEAGALDVHLAATHGILSGTAVERIMAAPHIVSVIVSDTVPHAPGALPAAKFRVYSVARLVHQVIECICTNGSVSDLFRQ